MITQPTTPDQAYLEKYWEMIAAIAWKEFTVHGRGAVLVQNVGQRDEEAIFLTTQMLASPLTAQYALMAAEYDPEREIVVIFMRPASSVSAYKGGRRRARVAALGVPAVGCDPVWQQEEQRRPLVQTRHAGAIAVRTHAENL